MVNHFAEISCDSNLVHGWIKFDPFRSFGPQAWPSQHPTGDVVSAHLPTKNRQSVNSTSLLLRHLRRHENLESDPCCQNAPAIPLQCMLSPANTPRAFVTVVPSCGSESCDRRWDGSRALLLTFGTTSTGSSGSSGPLKALHVWPRPRPSTPSRCLRRIPFRNPWSSEP